MTRKTWALGACLIGAFAMAAVVAAQHGGNALRQEIESANAAFMAAFAKGDAAALAKMYTTDGQALPPNADTITGPAALQQMWDGAFKMGVKSVKLETVELDGHDAMAFEIGRYTMLGEAGKELDRGKYLVVWKKEGGAWKLYRDIWNSSMPAAR